VSQSTNPTCPECGAALAAGQIRCWLCQRRLDAASPQNPYASPRPTGENVAVQFSLESLFLIITLVAVLLGTFLTAPGLGFLLGIVVVPALVRTMIDITQYKKGGSHVTLLGKVGSFLISILVVCAAGMAASIAAAAVCTAGALTGDALSTGTEWIMIVIPAGLLAGLVTAIWIFWLTRPRG
jgi:hypothetical protein